MPSSNPPRILALAVLVGALVIGLLVFLPRGEPGAPIPDPAAATPAPPARGSDPAPPPNPAAVAPAERPISPDASRQTINAVTTSQQAAATHRVLTEELMNRLAQLAPAHDPDQIRVATEELADRFYLLDRVVQRRNLEAPGPASLAPADQPRMDALHRLWQENPDLALIVDGLFSQRNLLTDEHVPQMLRRWMKTDPED